MVRPERYASDNSGYRRPWSTPDIPFLFKSVFVRLIVNAVTGHSLEPSVTSFFNTRVSEPGVTSPEYSEILGDKPLNVIKKNRPIYFERNIANMIAVAKQQKIDIMFLTWPYSQDYQDIMSSEHYKIAVNEHNDILRNLSIENGLFLLDLEQSMPKDGKYYFENRHVNALGARLKAKLTADGIAAFVCSRGMTSLQKVQNR